MSGAAPRISAAAAESRILGGFRRVSLGMARIFEKSRTAALLAADPLPDAEGPLARAASVLRWGIESLSRRASERWNPAWRESRVLPLFRWSGPGGWGEVPLRTWGGGLVAFAAAAAAAAWWREGGEGIGLLLALALAPVGLAGLLLITAPPRARSAPEDSVAYRLVRVLTRHPGPEDVGRPVPAPAATGEGAPGPPRRHLETASLPGRLLIPALALGGVLGGLSPGDFFLATAACLFLAAVLRHPRFGVYGAAAAYPLIPDLAGLAVVLAVGGLGLGWCFLRGRLIWPSSPVAVPLALFALVLASATVTSLQPAGSLRDLGLHGAGLSLALLLPQVMDRTARVHRFLLAAGAALGALGLVSLNQFVAGVPIDPSWVDPSQAIETRVFATFGNPNVLAEHLVLMLPLFVGVTLVFRRHPSMLLPLIALTAGGATLLLTFSRGGWLALAAALVVIGLLYDRRILVFLAAAALAGAFLAPDAVLARAASAINLADSSNAYRVDVWGIALRMIADFWVTGIGLGYQVFRLVAGEYSRFLAPYHAHNLYLQFLLELGAFGTVAFLWLLASMGRAALRASRSPDRYLAGLGVGLAGSLAALLAYGLVEHILYMPKVIFTFWILVGLILSVERLAAGSAAARPSGSSSESL